MKKETEELLIKKCFGRKYKYSTYCHYGEISGIKELTALTLNKDRNMEIIIFENHLEYLRRLEVGWGKIPNDRMFSKKMVEDIEKAIDRDQKINEILDI